MVMVALVVDARRWGRLAARSGVGARSEAQVRRALGGLKAEGWRLQHSLPWGGRGDIDSVAIAPTGVACVLETKTRTFDARHLARVREAAAGCTVIAGAGAVGERSRCCAWCAHVGSSMSRTRFWWCRSTAWCQRSEPAPGPHPAHGSWRGSPRPGSAKRCGELLTPGPRAGGGVGEHADEQKVPEAVGDRLGHGRCVAVEGADRQRGEPAGLLGVLDRGRRIVGR
jgi:Nuclease-related domain